MKECVKDRSNKGRGPELGVMSLCLRNTRKHSEKKGDWCVGVAGGYDQTGEQGAGLCRLLIKVVLSLTVWWFSLQPLRPHCLDMKAACLHFLVWDMDK